MRPAQGHQTLPASLTDMAITDTNKIDAISINKETGECVLTISDHLTWGDNEHIWYLQEKLNAYLRFIESGEIYESYLKSKDRHLRIDLVLKYEPTDFETLLEIKTQVEKSGTKFTWRHLATED
jgi:hypothetical protein